MKLAVMKTSAPPISVRLNGQTPTTPTFRDSVRIGILTNQPKSVEERIYLRWSTDHFISSHMVAAAGSGLNYSATIPAQPAGTGVQYCVATSTADLSALVTSGTIDPLTLSTSSNSHFVVAPGANPSPTPTATPPPTPTATATATPTATPTPAPPNPPSNLRGSVPSRARINLLWTDNANNENGFTLQRADAGIGQGGPCGTFVTIQPSLPANTTGFNDTGLQANHWYCYRVRAFNGRGNSSWSNTLSIRTH